jgi:hypothetical protein
VQVGVSSAGTGLGPAAPFRSLDSASNVKLDALIRTGPSVPSVEADGPADRSHRADPVRYASVDPATQRSIA